MKVNPDEPVTAREYTSMKRQALKCGTGPLARLEREDRAFLVYEVDKYEKLHSMPQTFEEEFVTQEYNWWRSL
jgi:hypothetical protein